MANLQKSCQQCSRLFEKPYYCGLPEWQRRKYCSKDCLNKAPRSEQTRTKMSLAKLGKPSWNKGKPWSESHRAALRKPHGPIKTTLKMLGRRPWNKIGNGITPINERIRKSSKYRAWRNKVFERDDYTCQICGKRGGNLHVDHIKPFAIYIELRFDLANGRTLCIPCHRKTESYGQNQWTVKKVHAA